jgi:hypothetical protein
MELVLVEELQKPHNQSYYLLHHMVMKESSSFRKLGVVSEANSKTASGVSLNDKLIVGPKLQDVVPLLIRFWQYAVPLIVDVAKMYHQVKVHRKDTDFQWIVWQEGPKQPIQDY